MQMKQGGYVFSVGPFVIRLQTVISTVGDGVELLYQDYPTLNQEVFADFYVRIFPPSGLRRFWRKQVLFAFDQFQPFKPLPYAQALPFFEWGLNWCISGYAHQFLIIHAAVLEKSGSAVVLPGEPGAGKSTLCAAMTLSGWRLLSDELTLIDKNTGLIIPVPRPVSLKNQSIDIIKTRFPEAVFSPTVDDTLKGSVALMKPPTLSVLSMNKPAKPVLVVFPTYKENASFLLEHKAQKAEAFMQLAPLSFNYPVLGGEGFNVLTRFVENSEFYSLQYNGDLPRAISTLEQLVSEHHEFAG